MGRCIRFIITSCLLLTLNISANAIIIGIQTTGELLILLDGAGTVTYTLYPIDWSLPTDSETDGISGMGYYYGLEPQEAWLAFDLSGIPDDAQITKATLSAYLTNWGTPAGPVQRTIWYYTEDSWINPINHCEREPGDNVNPAQGKLTLVGTIFHNESHFTWKTIDITHNWSNDLADNYISFMLTGPENGAILYGAVGLVANPDNEGNYGLDKVPELRLEVGTPSPISVTSPNGGESWQAGTLQTITWNKSETAGTNVKIELYKNDSFLSNIIVSTANDGEYSWLIPSVLPADAAYKIKITDTSNSSIYDYSDNYFSISSWPPSAGSLQFKNSSYSVTENGGAKRIYVSRTGGSYGAASVNYTTSNGTASAGSDYTSISGLLTWANEDTADKYFDVSITNDNTYEGDETFTVNLMNAIGATLGSPNQTTVTITDDDQPHYTIYSPAVDTLSSINVTSSTAALAGLLKNDGCDEIEESCLCRFSFWKTGDKGNIKSTDWQSGISEGQNFYAAISGLDPNTVYYFYAQAKNSAGQANGSSLTFKTHIDPNTPPAAFDPNEPNTLFIQNFVKYLQNDSNQPHKNMGLVTYVEGIGLNGLDVNDVPYSDPAYARESKIVSVFSVQKGKASVFYELSKDARPDNAQNPLLETSIYSSWPNDPNITSENSLKFWLAKNAFKGKTITIQKVSTDPKITFPVWDVNQIISRNGRQMPLSILKSQKLNVPYAHFILSTSRQILDLNDDGIVDLADYALLQTDVGKIGAYRSDIACMKGTLSAVGIPDGKVNATDVIAFISEYNKKHSENPIPNPYGGLSEDFESGVIDEPFFTTTSPWVIDSDSHTGQFSAKSGDIGNNRSSIIKASVQCVSRQISFYRKVSSESGCDELIFYIDGVEIERWSGSLDWEKMTYQASQGTHTLKWEYKKDWSLYDGDDSAWIDDIVIQ